MSIVYFTSTAVKSAPLCHFTFSLNFTKYDLLSALENSSAKPFSSLKLLFTLNKGSNISFDKSCTF